MHPESDQVALTLSRHARRPLPPSSGGQPDEHLDQLPRFAGIASIGRICTTEQTTEQHTRHALCSATMCGRAILANPSAIREWFDLEQSSSRVRDPRGSPRHGGGDAFDRDSASSRDGVLLINVAAKELRTLEHDPARVRFTIRVTRFNGGASNDHPEGADRRTT
jgi:hypothetical protein